MGVGKGGEEDEDEDAEWAKLLSLECRFPLWWFMAKEQGSRSWLAMEDRCLVPTLGIMRGGGRRLFV